MSLRIKVINLLLALFAIYAVVEHAVQQLAIYPKFVELERAEASRNMQRAIEALQREIDLLIPSVNDWPKWDDTYQYVQNRNDAYVTANLNAQALEGLGINAMAFYDRAGELVWGLGYDLEASAPMDMPNVLPGSLDGDHFLLGRLSNSAKVAGILQSLHGPLLVAAKPVMTSAGEGSPMGIVLIARLLTPLAFERLSSQAEVDLKVSAPEA